MSQAICRIDPQISVARLNFSCSARDLLVTPLKWLGDTRAPVNIPRQSRGL
jgi:hypothetical protein